MGKLTEFMNKGVRLIVSDTGAPEAAPAGEPEEPRRPPREIPREALEAAPPKKVSRSELASDVADFAAVYKEAGIEVPAHGYGIEKVAEMLQNKRFATLAPEARATAVMVALEAAGAPIRDVVQDAVQRDKALDNFEGAKERELHELKTKNEARIKDLSAQMEELIKKINSEVESLKQSSDAAAKAFAALVERKRREEDRLHEVVAQFIEGADNPITRERPGSPPPPPKSPNKTP